MGGYVARRGMAAAPAALQLSRPSAPRPNSLVPLRPPLLLSSAVGLGASPLTLAGLSGVGDIVLTCTGDLSRNRTVGVRLGKGEKLEDITATMGVRWGWGSD